MRILSFSKFRRGGRSEVNMRGDSSFWILNAFFFGRRGGGNEFFSWAFCLDDGVEKVF